MSAPHDEGGAAFPAQPIYRMPGGVEMVTNQGGMTLRDYFAAKAMQALIAERCYPWDKQAPIYAYEIADAMLRARQS